MRYLENETIWVKDNSIFVIRGSNSTNIGNKKIYCQCPLTDTNDINQARYQKFCSKTKIPEPQQLPPTKDEFFLHCQRANYIACIWKSALTVSSTEPDPDGHGWFRSDEGDLSVKWMSQKPAPEKSGCRNNMCICVANELKCTDICGCTQSSNSQPEQDSPEEYEQYCETDD